MGSMSKLLEDLNQALMLAQFRVAEICDRIDVEIKTHGYVSRDTAINYESAESHEDGLLQAIAIAKRHDTAIAQDITLDYAVSLLRGDKPINKDTALRLKERFGIPSGLWMAAGSGAKPPSTKRTFWHSVRALDGGRKRGKTNSEEVLMAKSVAEYKENAPNLNDQDFEWCQSDSQDFGDPWFYAEVARTKIDKHEAVAYLFLVVHPASIEYGVRVFSAAGCKYIDIAKPQGDRPYIANLRQLAEDTAKALFLNIDTEWKLRAQYY